ncbi:MAG: HAD-IA family hydrolase [Pseudomonadota bacterium]
MTPIAVVAWDFDGVLNRSIRDGRFLWAEQFEADIGHALDGFVAATFRKDWDAVMTGRADLRDRVAAWADEVGYGPGPDALIDYWFAHDARPDPTMLALMDRVEGLGLRQVIATNNERRRAAYIEQDMGFGARVETIFASGRLGVAKPDRAFFDLVATQVDVPPDEIVLIDDLTRNVEAACAAGWRAVLMRDGDAGHLVAQLAQQGLDLRPNH